jgi:hypothetical protein
VHEQTSPLTTPHQNLDLWSLDLLLFCAVVALAMAD